MALHVKSFGGGVALLGSADTRAIDEVLEADSLDIGPRGALICSSDVTDYITLFDGAGTPVAVSAIRGMASAPSILAGEVAAVTDGDWYDVSTLADLPTYLLNVFAREGVTTTYNAIAALTEPAAGVTVGDPVTRLTNGVQLTTVTTPGVFPLRTGLSVERDVLLLINVGPREGDAPRTAPGLYAVLRNPAVLVTPSVYPIQKFDALGTGPFGSYNIEIGSYGTKSQQLYFVGIATYNNYVFGWGFDSADAVQGDGPCRVMFCNLGNPLKWGNDNIAPVRPPKPETDRLFTDSDAITLGSAGERIRAAIAIFGKLYFGTDRGMHFLQGYGRDTFITNGATPVMKAENVVGPRALIEGPDKLMYGVGDQGLWSFDGYNTPVPLFQKLVAFDGRSVGWWDLLWTDSSQADGVPGKANRDLVWMAVDWARQQVLVGIPFCNSAVGVGRGNDTVVVRYHVRTGGFTRQCFRGVAYVDAGYYRREAQFNETRLLAHGSNVSRYAYQATPATAAVMPARLPVTTLGYYDPWGADGGGVLQRLYLTLSWASGAALPLQFTCTASLDEAVFDTFDLTISATAPMLAGNGDLWLDTSNTDTNIGNALGSHRILNRKGYLLFVRNDGGWQQIAGMGAKGTRVTLPLPLERVTGTRLSLRVQTIRASGRFELEGLGVRAGEGVPDV